jgi:GTP-binding protein HflX
MYETTPQPARAMLVGVWDDEIGREEGASLLEELAGLCDTLGLVTAAKELIHRRGRDPRYGIGSGNAEALSALAKEARAECIVIDWDLSPREQRNWETLSGLSVFDRRELIIRIFSGRAQTREAVLQAELARLRWMLPRLSHKYIDLERQRGGSHGTRGSGETKLETDRRRVQEKISRLEYEIGEVRKRRSVQRRARERSQTPLVAIVGYTNAGKSSLLNALTGSDAFVENKLFATLDTTSRKIRYPDGLVALFTDTVGFIRRLPHDLVDAFRGTLEEAVLADCLVHVADASDPEVLAQIKSSREVLSELGAENTPVVYALNKIDAVEDASVLDTLRAAIPDPVEISCKKRRGLDTLLQRVRLNI